MARWHCYLLLSASVMTCLLIALGGVVCVTGSATSCPDWPGCFGRGILPAASERHHRIHAPLCRRPHDAADNRRCRRELEENARSVGSAGPPAIAIVFLLAVVVFGAMAVLRGLSPVVAAIDVGSALFVLALILLATVVAFARRTHPNLPDHPGTGGFARLSRATLGAVFLALVSGVLVGGQGSMTTCLGWPFWRVMAADQPGWPQIARMALALVGGLLIVAVVAMAWRAERKEAVLLHTATLAGLLFVVEMAVGAIMLIVGFNIYLMSLYVTAAAVLWALLVVLVAWSEVISALESERPEFARQGRLLRTGPDVPGALPPA